MLELEPDELEPDEPEPDEPEPDEPEPVEPEPELEESEPGLVPVLLRDDVPDLVAAVLDEPGSASTTAPAASTLATPTVAVVVVTRLLARCRAATARATASRFRLFMAEVSPHRLGRLWGAVSEPPLSSAYTTCTVPSPPAQA